LSRKHDSQVKLIAVKCASALPDKFISQPGQSLPILCTGSKPVIYGIIGVSKHIPPDFLTF
jgi:hypothetical protein